VYGDSKGAAKYAKTECLKRHGIMDIKKVKFDGNGLVPVITQDAVTGEVLMQAYMNEQALKQTLEQKRMVYYSRSKQELWRKGDTSGHYQSVVESYIDCDGDSLLFKVLQEGVACHTGKHSCYFEGLEDQGRYPNYKILFDIIKTVKERKANPKEGSYTNYLLDKGVDKICKKIGEESTETVLAAKNNNGEELAAEAADLLYHLVVLFEERNADFNDVFNALCKREGLAPHPKYKNLGEKK
jgi:phosphoribosyl-ATP pyrophosphohydrolase/phosphoribosyl-AMP cyclohydrolase